MFRQVLLIIICCLALGPIHAQNDRFFVSMNGGDLYKVYLESCSTTLIGNTGLSFVGDIAMTPSGELYGLASGALYRIDTTTAIATYIGQTTSAIGTLEGISLAALNDTILVAEYFEYLFAISTTDASTVDLGEIGYSAIGDLVWFFGDLYMSAGGQLIRITLSADLGYIQSVTTVGPFNGFMPIMQGLATVTAFDGTANIIGVAQAGLYCYLHVDGSYQFLCSPLSSGIVGAASAPPIGVPAPDCDLTTTSNDASRNAAMQFYPNPTSSSVTLQLEQLPPGTTVVVRDALGREVLCRRISDQYTTISFEHSGVYMVDVLNTNGRIASERVVVE